MPIIPRERPEPPAKAFNLATPSDVYWKLLWELGNLKRSEAEEAGGHDLCFASAYHAYNFAVTAWHLIDWVWAASDDDLRLCISGFFKGAPISRMQHLTKAIAGRYRAIHICGQIANGSKHYVADRTDDPAIEAKTLWMTHQSRFAYQRTLVIKDGEDGDYQPALDVFKNAVRAWDEMLGRWGFMEGRYIGPDSDPPPWA